MWTYEQSTGWLYDQNLKRVAQGYSGKGVYKNDPASESYANRGPIPAGFYAPGEPEDSKTHGPFVISLAPDSSNGMYGRSGFLMHGDSIEKPGDASEGCIVMPKFAREAFIASGHDLKVKASVNWQSLSSHA